MDHKALKIRVTHGNSIVMGPGKADLLEAIDAFGSISSAARHMQMSYKRAWDLVDVLNKSFTQPLVVSSPGGSHGGGAKLTDFGRFILTNYRELVAKANASVDAELRNILSNLTPFD